MQIELLYEEILAIKSKNFFKLKINVSNASIKELVIQLMHFLIH